MRHYKGPFDPDGLTISYKELGTISMEELKHAILADIVALQDIYNVQYVTAPRLKLFVTNEYGEKIRVRRRRADAPRARSALLLGLRKSSDLWRSMAVHLSMARTVPSSSASMPCALTGYARFQSVVRYLRHSTIGDC